MNGLDLFSGIGGLSIALKPWVRTAAYCERDRYAQAVLLSRMHSNDIDRAPIWDDVTSLRGAMLPSIDIIFGGFPCQDISIAGRGAGLAGERSGLYMQIERLVEETKPSFVFLENVPAIRTRGLGRVVWGLASIGYDLRWTVISAASVGAPHKRDRWFLLAYSNSTRKLSKQETGFKPSHRTGDSGKIMADSIVERLQSRMGRRGQEPKISETSNNSWWATEPCVGRVVDGLPTRVDRIRCLGNSVVPEQAREAFKILSGLGVMK